MKTIDFRNSEQYWRRARLPKYSRKGVERAVDPSITIRRATKVAKKAGITRVAEVTDLDRLGIPNFMTVRPRDTGLSGISYYNGKGTTRADAHAGALMEAIERHAGERCNYEVITGSCNDVKRTWTMINPDDILVPRSQQYSDDLVLEWVAGFDLISGRETLAPLNCVVCPYTSLKGSNLFFTSSNGLASGNTLTEALCHALCELIERDTQSIAMARLKLRSIVRGLISKAPEQPVNHRYPKIALEGLPRRARLLIKKIFAAGLNVLLRNLTGTAKLPTIDCTLFDLQDRGFGIAHGGIGAHPDSRVALLRALTEAAQSRLSCIQGGREDLEMILTHKGTDSNDYLEDISSSEGYMQFKDIPTWEHGFIDEDVDFILTQLPQFGFDQVLAYDLTDAQVAMPVVRVVMPRAESWCVFHSHTGRAYIGDRVVRELSE